MSDAAAAGGRPGTVTTTDLWKIAALILITLDHLGEYLLPGQEWLRAIGRGGAPIFFFLIGFARTRAVPWHWLAAGALLTGLDLWREGEVSAITLNILISFALLRWTLPWAERLIDRSRWWSYVIVALMLAAIPLADLALEYGTTGPLFALVGLLHRHALAHGPDSSRSGPWIDRRLIGAFAALAYGANELISYRFAVPEAWLMALVVITVSGLLLSFHRADLRWQPGGALAATLRFCGVRSLELYIGQVIVLLALGRLLGVSVDDAQGEDET